MKTHSHQFAEVVLCKLQTYIMFLIFADYVKTCYSNLLCFIRLCFRLYPTLFLKA